MRNRRTRCVVSRARLQVRDHFGTALDGALHHGLNVFGAHELSDRRTLHRGKTRPAHHTLAVRTKCPGFNVARVGVELFAYRERKPRGIEHATHAHKALRGQTRLLEGQVGHDVKRVSDTDKDSVGRGRHRRINTRRHDLSVYTK